MALYLHLGVSGSGKTHRLYHDIFKEAAEAPDRSFLLIVPEQFTLQTQRDMIKLSDRHGIMNIDVLSFPRMAHRVFEELGVKVPVILEDTGKSMIVKKVALDSRDKLGIYAGKIGKQGFIDEMKSVIAEFYQYGIDDDRLARMMELAEGRQQLKSKLKDIAVIYEGFKRFTEGRFIMNEELLETFRDSVPKSKVLKDACIYFDGFTGFTVAQLRVIEELLKRVKDLHVTVTIEPEEADRLHAEEELFYLSSKTIEKLTSLADKVGVRVIKLEPEDKDQAPYRFRTRPALAGLEHNLFRPGADKGLKDHESIRLISCDSPLSEIKYVIGQISRLVNEEGCRYKDIAVVSKDAATYGRIAKREFARAGIPYFIDEKHNILGTEPVELLRAAIEIAEYDYTFDGVFRMIKTGLTPISAQACSALENYCLARGIRGRRMWTGTWTGRASSRYETNLEYLNEQRASLVRVVDGVAEVLRASGSTVRDRIEALKGLMEACAIREKLEEEAESLLASTIEDQRLKGRESAQLHDIILKVFERIELLLGDDVISLKEFREILDTGFKEAKLALTPPASDGVLIGDIERSRLNDIRALFFVGVNDGIIPGRAADKGLLSDADRTIFAENDIELSPTGRQSSYLSEFYLYWNMTKPSLYLYLTYHRMTADKQPGRPSYIIPLLTELFDGLKVENCYAGDRELLKGSDRQAIAAAIVRDKKAEELSPAEATVLRLLEDSDPGAYKRILEAAFFAPVPERMTEATALALYNRVLKGSISLLEKYAQCAFAHFINYGLKLEERKEYRFDSIELGNIYHKAIELYGKSLKEEGILWHDTTPELRERLAKQSLDEALRDYEELLAYSKRNAYMQVRLERVVKRTIDILDEQIKQGEFEPEYYEKSFTHATSFMTLRGIIDRMDITRKNGKTYLRVVDYKSGSKSFDLNQLFYGLQLQLAVYMNEGVHFLKDQGIEAERAGLYYYMISDHFSDNKDPQKVAADIKNKLKLNGPTSYTYDAIVAGDTGFINEDDPGQLKLSYRSSVIKAGFSNEGKPYSGSILYSPENLEQLAEFTENTIRKLGTGIMSGDTGVSPYRMGKNTPCQYCSYKGVCGFDRQLGYNYRELQKYGDLEIWQKINGAQNSSK